ncbi:NAD(P)-dependent oxidoreductase [Halorarum halophilum]|uniref:NAD(P)-dependent oxidoreductase n=1 Tax=Halorarum halophilum TaxID=2743090 RepID=A0A7D5KER5_9EURY|nr:NAD(P)-dependent oxidoreductase [Halobaculum halophilum]QLG27036.1 NAD(P)-dependent oxidoreductase [Halobaculum halophilum]
MDVLVTGAHGVVGTAITDYLGDDDRYDFTLLDVEEGDGPGETVVADVLEYEELRPHFDDQDAVVHLARIPGLDGPDSRAVGWSDPLAGELEAITNVYEAAIDADLDSVVYASSNHAVGMVEVRNEPEVYHDTGIRIGHEEPHRPDSLYGVTKTYGEDLGRLAAEAHGIQCYGLRIGAVRSPEYDHPYGDAERGVDDGKWERGSDEYEEQVARMKGLWQSRRDLAHLVDCCLQDDSVEWDHFYGVSANDRRWLDDLDRSRTVIGYDPRDNGEEWDGPPE